MQKSFGATAKLVHFCASCFTPCQTTRDPLTHEYHCCYFGSEQFVVVGFFFFFFFAFSRLFKHPWQRWEHSKGARGFIYFIDQGGIGDDAWEIGVWWQLFLTSVSSHIISGYILHRLPYVGLGSKIEVMRAAERNLVHSKVKDMYMGHVWML